MSFNIEEKRIRKNINANVQYKHNPDKYKKCMRKYILYSKYKITLAKYEIMLANQNSCCKICGRHQSELKKALGVDHDHITGKIRGLLCQKCNTGLGYMNDSSEQLRIAADYLNSNK
jgi:hypothetical protein